LPQKAVPGMTYTVSSSGTLNPTQSLSYSHNCRVIETYCNPLDKSRSCGMLKRQERYLRRCAAYAFSQQISQNICTAPHVMNDSEE